MVRKRANKTYYLEWEDCIIMELILLMREWVCFETLIFWLIRVIDKVDRWNILTRVEERATIEYKFNALSGRCSLRGLLVDFFAMKTQARTKLRESMNQISDCPVPWKPVTLIVTWNCGLMFSGVEKVSANVKAVIQKIQKIVTEEFLLHFVGTGLKYVCDIEY